MKTAASRPTRVPGFLCLRYLAGRHVARCSRGGVEPGRTTLLRVHAAPSTYAAQPKQNATYVSSEARAALFGQAEEAPETEAAVKGTIPHWIQGSLLLNGGGDYSGMSHMFDGYAMLCKFAFDRGHVTGSQWYIQSEAYRHFSESGSMRFTEFGTPSHASLPPAQRLLKNVQLMTSGQSIITDNPSVNVVPLLDGTVLAVSESLPSIYQLDMRNPQAMRQVKYQDGVPGLLTTAHPKVMADGTLVNFTRSIPLGGFHVYQQDPLTLKRTQIAFIRDRDPLSPCWVHDLAMSRDHLVIVENPLFMSLPALMIGAVGPCLNWKPERGTRVHVVPLRAGSGHEVQTFEAPPFFSFHSANAFEQDGVLHVDLAVYEDAAIMQDLLLDQLRSFPGPEVSRSGLRRISIPLSGAALQPLDAPRSLVHDESSHGDFCEFPCVNPSKRGQRHRYVWFSGAARPTNMGNALAKVDVETGDVSTWHEEGALPGGPVFLAAPGGVAEDQGVILTVVMSKAGNSFLLVLDAASMRELGRAELPYAVPYRFHGAFLPSDAFVASDT